MKAITIQQPYATLIALGEKQFETRSWSTKHRGPLAIHAAKTIMKESMDYTPVVEALARHGIHSVDDLPTSAIIAVCNLDDCLRVDHDDWLFDLAVLSSDKQAVVEVKQPEYDLGNYEEGRYAWQLSNVKAIEPVPVKGALRVWEWDGEVD